MAKKAKKITLSSERQKEIESSYVSTAEGRFIFVMMFINTIVLLIGLLFSLYIVVASYQNMNLNENISQLADKFLVFGSLITLICLFYYIRYSNSYKPEKKSTEPKAKVTKKKTTKSSSTKKPTNKKTTKK
ncbi:MAG: hypothetical protein PUA90_01940 [bacterium]|nr:hypothetical protein [bacterium]